MTFTVQVEYGNRIWRDDKSFKLINSCTKGCD